MKASRKVAAAVMLAHMVALNSPAANPPGNSTEKMHSAIAVERAKAAEEAAKVAKLQQENADLRKTIEMMKEIERRKAAHLEIEPVAQLEFSDGDHLMLMAPMVYQIGESDYRITVPAGFVHDRASVPPVLRSVMSTHGKHGKAAIVHDYLYWSQTCDQKQADNLMYIAMLESGVSAVNRTKVSAALAVGGSSAFQSNRRAKEKGDFRIVPEHHRKLSAGESWKDFHARLKSAGVADPGFEKASAFCAVGNSRVVPRKA